MRVMSLLWCMFLLPSLGVFAQTAAPVPAVSQANQAFSQGRPVSSVEMTGTAHWMAGSTEDSGPVTLTAKVTGENRAEFDLSSGSRVEAQSAIGDTRTCIWSGKDGVTHNMASSNCWTATVWFLPHLALQSGNLPPGLSAQSSNSQRLRHQLHIAPGRTKPAVTDLIQAWSTTDLTLDPVTSLPTVLKYAIHPDNNSKVNLQVEVRYSNYQKTTGVMLPMHIERYVNGALEVSIDINSATINRRFALESPR